MTVDLRNQFGAVITVADDRVDRYLVAGFTRADSDVAPPQPDDEKTTAAPTSSRRRKRED